MNPALLTFLAVFLLILGIYEEWQAPRRRIAAILRRTETLADVQENPLEDGLLRWALHWLTGKLKPWMPSEQMVQLRQQLLWAGQPFGLTAEEFFFTKIGTAVGLALAFPVLMLAAGSSPNPGYMLMVGAVGYILPERLLEQRIQERTRQIRIQLPHFVDLLATALEAGLPLIESIRRVAEEAPGLLAAEMMRAVQEMAAGKPAATAWEHLSGRTNCAELQDVVIVIMQSQEYGVGVAKQLRFQMRTMRLKKQQHAQERAQAASAKMRVPIILFILAPTMIILLGPSLMTVLRQLRGG